MQHYTTLWRNVYKTTRDGTSGQQAHGAYKVDENDAAFYSSRGRRENDKRDNVAGGATRGAGRDGFTRANRAAPRAPHLREVH